MSILGNATTLGGGVAAGLGNSLLFTSPNDFTLGLYDSKKHWDGTLEWTNGTTPWQTWDGATTLQSRHGFLALRGTGNTRIMGGGEYSRFVLTGADIRCGGNIETLLDYRTVAEGNHPQMGQNCFSWLFYGCAALTAAPALPATTLANYCYARMFQGCTSLTVAPALPAVTLAYVYGCYMGMFKGCTSLTAAPALPATTLARVCYEEMFYGCTSLRTAPALPATTLMEQCYCDMFRDCTSLTTAPALPATTLGEECYAEMFMGCTSLRTAPALPATTLRDMCYYEMFSDCTALKLSAVRGGDYQYEYRIPSTGTGTDGFDALSDMFTGTGGTFTGTPTINTTYYTTNAPVV